MSGDMVVNVVATSAGLRAAEKAAAGMEGGPYKVVPFESVPADAVKVYERSTAR